MSVKLVDIARKTGYSVSTVSRALSGNSSRNKISQSTVEEIRTVAKKLGYRTNKLARSLKSKKTFEFGVTVSDIINPFFTTLIKSISNEVRKIGYTIMLCDSDENSDFEILTQSLSRSLPAHWRGGAAKNFYFFFGHSEICRLGATEVIP